LAFGRFVPYDARDSAICVRFSFFGLEDDAQTRV
jgi:hypothetical protein